MKSVCELYTPGETSTISAPTKFRPASPRIIRLTSRVVKPPASGVPAVIY